MTAGVAPSPVAAPRQPDAESSLAPQPWSRREWIWVGVLTAFVVVAGGWQLGHASLSGDEASTWAISAHGLGDVLHALRGSGGDRGAALYYLTVHFWIQLFGSSEVALRSFSLVAAAVAITPFHAIARRLGLARAASAEILLVSSPFFLTYARDARAYALLLLLVVLATWAFVRAVESDAPRDWVQYGAIATLALYTHWFAALVLAAHFLWWLGTKPDPRRRRRALLSAGWLALAALPIAVFALVGASGIEWIAPLSVAGVRSVAKAVTGTSSWSAQLVYLVVIVVALGAIVGERRARRPDRPGRWVSLSAAWLLVPIAATIVVSAFYPLLLARYLIVALPGYVLVVAIGLTILTGHHRALLVVGVAALVALSSPGYRNLWFHDGADENWRGIAQTVSARVGPDDAIIVDPSTAVYPFDYYAGPLPALRSRPGPTWPAVRWAAPFNRNPPTGSPTAVVAGLHSPQVWLVVRVPGGSTVRSSVTHSTELTALEAQLGHRYRHHVELVPSHGRTTARLILYADPRP